MRQHQFANVDTKFATKFVRKLKSKSMVISTLVATMLAFSPYIFAQPPKEVRRARSRRCRAIPDSASNLLWRFRWRRNLLSES